MSEKKLVSQVKNQKIVEKKRKQIVDAAGELFAIKGYHKTTLRDIAQASGINFSYLYKYISSKDDIFYLFYKRLREEIGDWYKPYLDNNGEIDQEKTAKESPVEIIKSIIRNVLEGINRMNDEVLTLITDMRHLQPDTYQAVIEQERNDTKLLEAVIRRGIEEGCFKTNDTFFAANLVGHILAVYPLRKWSFEDRYTFRKFVQSTTDFILSALGVDEKTK